MGAAYSKALDLKGNGNHIKQHGEGLNVRGRSKKREGNQNKRGKSRSKSRGRKACCACNKRVISEVNVHKEKLGKIREMRARMRILQSFLKSLSLIQLKSCPSLLMVQRKSESWINLGALFI